MPFRTAQREPLPLTFFEIHLWAALCTALWFTVLPASVFTDRLRRRHPHLSYDLTILQYYYLPIIGGLMAGLATTLAGGLAWVGFPPVAAAVLGGIALHALNGGIHLDGLADTTDALFAHGEDRFKVMTDPHIGGLGAIYAILITLTHVTLTATCFYLAMTENILFGTIPVVAAITTRVGCFYTLMRYYSAYHPTSVDGLFPPYYDEDKFLHSFPRFYLIHILLFGVLIAVFPAMMPIVVTASLVTLRIIHWWVPKLVRTVGFIYGDMLGAMILISEVVITFFATFIMLTIH